ncbi:MAG TPA: hypothetical protein PKC45_14140 [Gemmatales bacterium]|nr:hypothetical protein [Gemmatales bacterium]
MNDHPSQLRDKRATYLAALLSMLMVLGFLVFLYFLFGPLLLFSLAIVVGLILVSVFHYVVWGRAFMAETAQERAQLLAAEQAERAKHEAPWERRF